MGQQYACRRRHGLNVEYYLTLWVSRWNWVNRDNTIQSVQALPYLNNFIYKWCHHSKTLGSSSFSLTVIRHNIYISLSLTLKNLLVLSTMYLLSSHPQRPHATKNPIPCVSWPIYLIFFPLLFVFNFLIYSHGYAVDCWSPLIWKPLTSWTKHSHDFCLSI